MKLLDLFYPFPESYSKDTEKLLIKMRVASGLSVDSKSNNLFVVDPNPLTRKGTGIYELSHKGKPVGVLTLPNLGLFDSYGIAVELQGNAIWLTDTAANCLMRISRDGRILTNLRLENHGIYQPGVIAESADESSLFVLDRSRNLICHISKKGKKIKEISLKQAPRAIIRGVSCDPRSGNLFLSYAPLLPEENGLIGEWGIVEVTCDGHNIRRIDTTKFGFCPLDIAFGHKGDVLYAISREFVLPQTIGDHAHIFVLDTCADAEDRTNPNYNIVMHFLKQNNLYASHGLWEGTNRWDRLPVHVRIEGLIDMSVEDVKDVFYEWAELSSGRITFQFMNTSLKEGIYFTQGKYAFSSSGPKRNEIVTVSVCDKRNLTCHPHRMNRSHVQRNVARHEIGHAIGFSGHSPRFRIDTMNSISGFSDHISKEEAAFMTILYSHPPKTQATVIEKSVKQLTKQ